MSPQCHMSFTKNSQLTGPEVCTHMYQHFLEVGLKCLGIHLQEFLLVDSSWILKTKGAVDAFADDSHCPVECFNLAVEIPSMLYIWFTFLSCSPFVASDCWIMCY